MKGVMDGLGTGREGSMSKERENSPCGDGAAYRIRTGSPSLEGWYAYR